jgi:hypothetical protein
MFKKPLIAVCCIACGMVLIGAGLGYTVNQAALFTSSGDDDPGPGDPWDFDQTPEQTSDPGTSHFFFPALSLLSGAVLAAMGAIALAHRWRGIN